MCFAASHLGLFCLLTRLSSRNELKIIKITPDSPKNENGLQMITRESPFVSSGLTSGKLELYVFLLTISMSLLQGNNPAFLNPSLMFLLVRALG